MKLLRSFLALNRRLSQAITPDHFHEANVFAAYHKIGAMLLSHPDTRRVLDVGAGKHWHFPQLANKSRRIARRMTTQTHANAKLDLRSQPA